MNKLQRLKKYIKANPHVLILLYIPVYLLSYFAVEHLVPSDCDYWVSWMPLDDKIPFVDWFVVPYCMWYPFLIGVGLLLMVRDVPNFKKYAIFLITGFTICLAFCAIVPNGQNLRPEHFERETVFTWVISKIYAADTNTNVFPSMHVVGMLAGLAAAMNSPVMKRLRIPVAVLAVLVSASTVFIKQHSFLDVIGGAALCLPLYICIYTIPKLRAKRGKSHEISENQE